MFIFACEQTGVKRRDSNLNREDAITVFMIIFQYNAAKNTWTEKELNTQNKGLPLLKEIP